MIGRRQKPRPVGRKQPIDPLKIGIAVVLGVLLITYAGFHKRVPLVPRWTLKGQFTDTHQIRSGAPVRIAGVDVGQVTGTSRGPGTTAIVTMAINNAGQPIHTDARLTIRPRLFLEGGYYVQVDPGSPSAPTVASGHTIPVARTSTPVSFFNLISTLDRPTRANLIGGLHELSIGLRGGGAQGFDQLAKQLPSTFRSGAIAGQALQGTGPDDLSGTVAGLSGISATLAAHDVQLASLLTGFNNVAGTLASQDTALAVGLQALDTTLAASPAALSAVDTSLSPLTIFSTRIRPALKIAPPVLRKATQVLNQIDAISQPSQLPSLIGVLHPLAKALPALYDRLETLFPRLAPVATCINNQAIGALNTTLDDGALSSNQPVWRDLLHALTGLAADAANFDGNGSWSRFYGGVGPATVTVIPGLGPVLQSASFTGARPAWSGPGAAPPLRPDVPCTTQPLENLQTPAVGPSADHRPVPASALSTTSTQQLLTELLHPRLSRGHVAKKVVG